MNFTRFLLLGLLLSTISGAHSLMAQSQTVPAGTPTLRVTSRLVFLDVTVLDKKGLIVTSGLSKDDFSITEEKRPQRIFSFEQPTAHVSEKNVIDENPSGNVPLTVLVLDLLNSKFEDFAYIRYSVRKYLSAQPAQLDAPAELMVLGNDSLEMVQGYTRNKEELLEALDRVPAVLPYKEMNASFFAERFAQSIDALQQIALQNRGVAGRKNIVWVGHGSPGIFTSALVGSIIDELNQYVRDTTNMLVDARVSLFVIYPGLPVQGPAFRLSEGMAMADIGDNADPFAGDINFGVFVNETGGQLFYNRNDVDREMARAQQLGSAYYTLTYQPQGGEADGKFRRIRVSLRDPNLHALTKAGYYAPAKDAPVDPRQQMLANLVEAARSTIPFQAVNLTIERVVRDPEMQAVTLTVRVKPGSASWEAADAGQSKAHLTLAAVSIDGSGNILAARRESIAVTATTQDPARLAELSEQLTVTLRAPRETQTVRVVIQAGDSQRIGTAEVDRKAIDSAPVAVATPPSIGPNPASSPAP